MKDFPPISTAFTRCIALREFELRDGDSKVPVTLEVGEPVQDVMTITGFDWRCPVRLRYGNTEVNRYACGIDAIQALGGVMRVVTVSMLQTLVADKGGVLYFLGEVYPLQDDDPHRFMG